MTTWTAEFTNDPESDYSLYAELLADDQYKARLFYDNTNKLFLHIYGGSELTVPLDWLFAVSKELRTKGGE